jgi:steroid 5-alpha reductase family enzyme
LPARGAVRYGARDVRARGLLAQGLAYTAALLAAAAVAFFLGGEALWAAAAADVAATVVVFAFSVALSNSSLYDPYWSVAPPALFAYWLSRGEPSMRAWIAIALVGLWGARLTWNFLRGWRGLTHEDWRYRDLRAKSGRAYWAVSFLGIHFFPTMLTFGGSLSLWVVATAGDRPLGVLDGAALVVTLAAIAIEALADRQLRRFVLAKPPEGAILSTGLWRYSRHPNYFGEVLFWWGLFLFALAADPSRVWVVIDPIAITVLFVFVSVPLIDRRMAARRPAYAEHARRVSAIVPWFPGR